MHTLAPIAVLASDAGEIVLTGGLVIGMIVVVGNLIHKVTRSRAREQTKREIAAYVAEGSMTPEEGERLIKADVVREERLTASVGVAPTKFVAKIASDLRKPDGLVVVGSSEVEEFLAVLPIERLWGAGPKTVSRLQQLGIHRIGDLRSVPASAVSARVWAQASARVWAEASGQRSEARWAEVPWAVAQWIPVGRESAWSAGWRDPG